MAKALMSDAEIKRRKKAQGHISQTTSTLGLTGLGTLGAATAAKKGGSAFKFMQKAPKLKHITSPTEMHEKLKGTATNIGVVSGGVGGVGGYNFAAYTNAESRKRKAGAGMSTTAAKPAAPKKEKAVLGKRKKPHIHLKPLAAGAAIGVGAGALKHQVEKSVDELAPTYGEIAKAWEPSASQFDPEGKRMKRADTYPKLMAGAAGAAAAGAGYQGLKAANVGPKVKGRLSALKKPKTANNALRRLNSVKSKATGISGAQKTAAIRGGKLAAGATVLGGGAVLAEHKKKSESWSPYVSKSQSPFGVEH